MVEPLPDVALGMTKPAHGVIGALTDEERRVVREEPANDVFVGHRCFVACAVAAMVTSSSS